METTHGLSWSTDAIYRENRARVSRRGEEGCLVVEMEASAPMAIARYRCIPFGEVVMAGDSLADREWQHRGWMTAKSARPAVVRLGGGRRRRVDEVTGFQSTSSPFPTPPAQLQPGPGARAGGRLRCHVPMLIPGPGPGFLAGRSALVLVAAGKRGIGVGKSGVRSLYQQRSGGLRVFAALCGPWPFGVAAIRDLRPDGRGRPGGR